MRADYHTKKLGAARTSACLFTCFCAFNQWKEFDDPVYGAAPLSAAVDEREALEAPLDRRERQRLEAQHFARYCDMRAEGLEIWSESARRGGILEPIRKECGRCRFVGRHRAEDLLPRPVLKLREAQR